MELEHPFTVGRSAEASFRVQPADTAQALAISAEDVFPAVLATSRMIALMELAAARCMRPMLAEGQLSVGVGIDVKHKAATPIGSVVRATATCHAFDGKLYHFKVAAFDAAGSIGEGAHTRAIISAERLLAGAERRIRTPVETS
jgi:predicted thioesterase